MTQQGPIDPLLLDPNKTRTIGNYVIGKTLGKGTFGKVKSATHILTGEKVAVKILQKQKIVDVADVQRVSREIHILKLIRHPSIIQLYEIIQTPKQLFLIMEYMEGGQLFDYIVKSKKIPQQQACKIFQQIIGGIEYIHKLNIVHRDLKPQNLLIDYDKTIRIVDFGLSNTYRKDQRLKTACGSPCYAAPQMIQGKNRYEAIMVDVWSCGVILYAMLCGCLPFQDPQTSKLYQKILAGQYKIPKSLSEDAKDLLSKILNVDPTKRFRIQDIRKHKWWSLSPTSINFSNGIIVGYHRIPVDSQILDKTVKLGFELDFTKKCIEANRHNDCTTTYYLLLKKFIREGGISKTYLGSQYFDKSLIQPFKKLIPAKQLIQSHGPNSFSPKGNNQNQRNINSQPGISRKNYALGNTQSLNKKRDSYTGTRNQFDREYDTTQKSSHRHYTPGTKINSTIVVQPQRSIVRKERQRDKTISYTSSNSSKIQQQKIGKFQSQNHKTSTSARRQDLISRKYRQTYGASLISKSKQRQNSRKRSLKKYELSEIYENKGIGIMNQTIGLSPYHNQNGRKKLKSQRIGVDKGFGDNFNTINYYGDNDKQKQREKFDGVYRKPYLNRRLAYH